MIVLTLLFACAKQPVTTSKTAAAFECDTSINFISSIKYNQISLTDGCRQVSGQQVCNANPVYGDAVDLNGALEHCQVRCLEDQSCTGFFFQRHNNGHEICGFYQTDFALQGQLHGHAQGSQVCKRR